jgi:hypothetical protein
MQLPPFMPEIMITHSIFIFVTISNIVTKVEFCFSGKSDLKVKERFKE